MSGRSPRRLSLTFHFQHLVLATAGDYSPSLIPDERIADAAEQRIKAIYDIELPQYKTAKTCMGLVDLDRNLWAQESGGYNTFLMSLDPPTCTPKNNVIVGIPPM